MIQWELPADSRYKQGHRPGSPTGRYTAAEWSTGNTEKKELQLVDGDKATRPVGYKCDVAACGAAFDTTWNMILLSQLELCFLSKALCHPSLSKNNVIKPTHAAKSSTQHC